MASGVIEYSALIKEILRRKTKWLPFLVRCIVVYNWFYDEVIHKRILKLFVKKEQRKYLADGWAEIVGSYAEGTCVTGSDVDFIQRRWPVYCSPREFPNDVKSGLLVFTDDERIPPGCCWLRLYETTRNEIPRVTNGLEWFLSKGYKPDPIRCTAKVVDGHTHYSFRSNVDKSALVCYAPAMVLREDGNVYFSRAAYMGYHMKTGITVSPAINRVLPRWSSHGPAFTQKYFGLFNIDVVHALHCSSTWPSCAQEWKSRRRRFQWPSAALQEDIVNSGFDVVPIASKVTYTTDADFEWRISFRKAETKLVKSLSENQRYCLISLKILVKEQVDVQFPNEDFLSSYIMKMSLFWSIEKMEPTVWDDDITDCLNICILRLRKWVNHGFCPSYFMPNYNLFRTKLDRMFLLGFQKWFEQSIVDWKCLLKCKSFTGLAKMKGRCSSV